MGESAVGARSRTRRSVALVMGSGGIVGGAFHAGVLKALEDAWEIDAREVGLIVGTSAGSISGALVAAGLSPSDLFRRETRQPLSPEGARLLGAARARRGPKRDPMAAFGAPMAPHVMMLALAMPGRVSPGTALASMLPCGKIPTSHVADMVHGLFEDVWPTRLDLLVPVVELDTGQRVVFDATGPASPSEAVAASCAVPAVFEPVEIDGTSYIDAGVHSSDNLDVLGGEHYDLVVVSSPMGIAGPPLARWPFAARPPTMPIAAAMEFGGTTQAWNALRVASRMATECERQRLTGCKRVEIVMPESADLDAMGNNLLDPRRRPAVALQAYATASEQFAAHPL
ncbi:patatin-like phospholipase family protein [Candidatus Poriferisodalis sp.]|uniref:patatin-like phospholipase family protein n=1 Tax=Candidatus Poriferisodalis sp. TaxID=3101277 RepID=UPI003B019E6F